MSSRLARVVPATGILFAVLVVVATLLTTDAPGTDASDADIAAYYADGGNRTSEFAALLLIGLAAFCFLAFLGSLRGALASVEREPAPITAAAVAGGAVFIALAAASHAVGAAVAVSAETFDDFRVDPDTVRVLAGLGYTLFVTALFAAGVMTVSAATLSLRLGALPRWLGWFAVLATAAALVSFTLFPSIVVLAWIVAVSVYLTRPRTGTPEPAAGNTA